MTHSKADARVVEQNMELVLFAQELFGRFLDGREIREVELQKYGLPAGVRFQRLDGFLSFPLATRSEIDLRFVIQ